MQIDRRVYEETAQRLSKRTAVTARKTQDVQGRSAHLAFAGAKPSRTDYERMLGTNDLVDEFYLLRALAAAKPICRITTRTAAGHPTGYATGVMVSPTLVLTNWHVFPDSAEAVNAVAEFNFVLGIDGNPLPSVRFQVSPNGDGFFFSDPALDFALAAVQPTSVDGTRRLDEFGHHRLVPTTGKIMDGEWITIIQHPGGQPRQYAIRENELLSRDDNHLFYRSDTAPGSSGAPAFNDSFEIVALHHSGKAKTDANGRFVLRDGRTVTSLDGIDDSEVEWVANEGIRVSSLCRRIDGLDRSSPHVQQLLATINSSEDVMSETIRAQDLGRKVEQDVTTNIGASQTGMSIAIPLTLHVSLSAGVTPVAVPPPRKVEVVESSLAEKAKVPTIDPDYSNRHGYDGTFLGKTIPLPKPADLTVVSKTEDGHYHLKYEHFTVVMHKARRLALFCASNVDGTPESRTPESGRYGRNDLGGLGPKDKEAWLTDPRIPEQHQLPDRFYDKDGQAFDKGHIVRREDACWGSTRDQIVRANGDTFHTTNCSPQVLGFNRSGMHGLWGELENYVLEKVKGHGEKYSLYAGPVLDDETDRWFTGVGERGELRIQIPSRFWKVVAALDDDGSVEAFAFVLSQDLDGVPLADERFDVDERWRAYMIRLADLETLVGLRFPKVLKDGDQARRPPGQEVMTTGQIERWTRPRGRRTEAGVPAK